MNLLSFKSMYSQKKRNQMAKKSPLYIYRISYSIIYQLIIVGCVWLRFGCVWLRLVAFPYENALFGCAKLRFFPKNEKSSKKTQPKHPVAPKTQPIKQLIISIISLEKVPGCAVAPKKHIPLLRILFFFTTKNTTSWKSF